MNRRKFNGSALVLGLAALTPAPLRAQAAAPRYADMHCHLGISSSVAQLREVMSRAGMLVTARPVVADGPVIRRVPKVGYQVSRQAEAGELSLRFNERLERIRAEHSREKLIEIDSAARLHTTMAQGVPSVVISAEGADFLESDLQRLDAARQSGLRHLQLVHYRVSEVGDVCTDRPVHNGLSSFGREVVQACNRLGILVDVAHCSLDGMAQVLELSTRPVVYSHGDITAGSPHYTQTLYQARSIYRPLAREVAKRGGVIGIWPAERYRTLQAYADALIDAAGIVGAAHVGIGTDAPGLPNSVLMDFEPFRRLEELLVARGVKADDAAGILGGNYLRVLGRALET